MTDKEIIEAFIGCCISHRLECEDCIYGNRLDCLSDLYADIITLVYRQQDEIKELNTEIDKQYEQAVADIKGNLANGGVSCHWCIGQTKAEAIKEFVDRLGNYKEYRYNENCDFVPYVRLSDIDKVVKEMVGAEK